MSSSTARCLVDKVDKQLDNRTRCKEWWSIASILGNKGYCCRLSPPGDFLAVINRSCSFC